VKKKEKSDESSVKAPNPEGTLTSTELPLDISEEVMVTYTPEPPPGDKSRKIHPRRPLPSVPDNGPNRPSTYRGNKGDSEADCAPLTTDES
jgi:hypothetical protein